MSRFRKKSTSIEKLTSIVAVQIKNTEFFHATAYKIDFLRNNSGEWVYDQEELKVIVVDFYTTFSLKMTQP